MAGETPDIGVMYQAFMAEFNKLNGKLQAISESCRPNVQRRRCFLDNGGRRDDDHIEIQIPLFKGRKDVDVYLDWERKVEMFFSYHDYSNEKKVRLASMKFSDYALVWWDEIVKSRRRYGEHPIETWKEMKRVMRNRFVPSRYNREENKQLQKPTHSKGFLNSYSRWPSYDDKMNARGLSSKEEDEHGKMKMIDSKFQNLKGTSNSSSSATTFGHGVVLCCKCQSLDHCSDDCPSERNMVLKEAEIVSKNDYDSNCDDMSSLEISVDNDENSKYVVHDDSLVVKSALDFQVREKSFEQRNIFHKSLVGEEMWSLIIDGGNYTNVTSIALVQKLGLKCGDHLNPNKLQMLNDMVCEEMVCDVISKQVSHLMLVGVCQFDKPLHDDHKFIIEKFCEMKENEEAMSEKKKIKGPIESSEKNFSDKKESIETNQSGKKENSGKNKENEKIEKNKCFDWKSANLNPKFASGDVSLFQEIEDMCPKEKPRCSPPFKEIEHEINFVHGTCILSRQGKYNVSNSFNVSNLSPFVMDADSRTNLFEERGNDTSIGARNWKSSIGAHDGTYGMLVGLFTKAKAKRNKKRIKEGFGNIAKWLVEGMDQEWAKT